MKEVAFDNDKYLKLQSKHILERISNFDNKLYLEFGGKLFDDHHAARVLPGFQPDSKLEMLLELKEEVEIVIAVSANDIEKNKIHIWSIWVSMFICIIQSQGIRTIYL